MYISQIQKDEILQLIEEEKERLGSYRAVCNKCKISEATLSQVRKGSYLAEGANMLTKIGIALGYDFSVTSKWNIAATTNFNIVTQVLLDAKWNGMFMGIAENAGSGKTATSNAFLNKYRAEGVYKINCKEWAGRPFLEHILLEIGADKPKGRPTITELVEIAAASFKQITYLSPLLIIDQANSLRAPALRTLIHLYNELEDQLAVVILGTENLEHEIKRGIRLNKTGFDELDSRFGRKYIHLVGSTLNDVRRICEANGISDPDLQRKIFYECEPKRKEVEVDKRVKQINVVEDMRRLKRLIIKNRIQQNQV